MAINFYINSNNHPNFSQINKIHFNYKCNKNINYNNKEKNIEIKNLIQMKKQKINM